MMLLLFDLFDDEYSEVGREIIQYDTSKRPRHLFLFLKLIYLFMNQIPIEKVREIFQIHFPHLLGNLDRDYAHIVDSIKKCVKLSKDMRKAMKNSTTTKQESTGLFDETAYSETDQLNASVQDYEFNDSNFNKVQNCENHQRSK